MMHVNHHSNSYHNNNNHHYNNNGGNIRPSKQLMSFQSFVRTLNNSVDETTAYKKYKDFMADLSQSKVGRFFDANKDREWFRLKYHPIESQKTLHKQNLNFLKRLKIFNQLNEKRFFDTLPYSVAKSQAILNLMDAIIVYLEDGSQELVDQLLAQEDDQIDLNLKEKYISSKPNSVVIDDVTIETTLAEIQELCLRADANLVRIAQLEPYYIEGGILRQKFVAIYQNGVDMRDVCWKLSRFKLHNKSLSVSINKCLTTRIHTFDAIANHHMCVVNDIRNAVILTLNFDELKGLYGKRKQLLESTKVEPDGVAIKMEVDAEVNSDVAPLSPTGSEKSVKEDEDEKPFDVSSFDEEKEKEKKKLFEFKFNTDPSLHRQVSKLNKSKNPILEGAYVYLVEFAEATAAQYYLSHVTPDLLSQSDKEELARNDTDKFATIRTIVSNLSNSREVSIKFLDRILWYLRIVHSFDYYKKALYKQEDELSHRMSVIHLREEPTTPLDELDDHAIREYLNQDEKLLEEFGQSQAQKYVSKDEERFNYKSYGKVITDELASYAQRIQKPKSNETEEVYKCKHCTRVFQKLSDIGRHFVSKHKWAIDAIEVETDFFNAYLFDATKINPVPPKSLLEVPENRFTKMVNFSQMGEDPDLLQQAVEAYSKMEYFVREPAPRSQVESDPRNEMIVDYTDISFDDAI